MLRDRGWRAAIFVRSVLICVMEEPSSLTRHTPASNPARNAAVKSHLQELLTGRVDFPRAWLSGDTAHQRATRWIDTRLRPHLGERKRSVSLPGKSLPPSCRRAPRNPVLA